MLDDQVNLLQSIEGLIELGDIRMIEFLHDLDLPLNPFPSVRLQQLKLFVNLACDLLIGFLVQSDSHHCVGSLAYALAYQVVVEIIGVAGFCAVLIRNITWRSRAIILVFTVLSFEVLKQIALIVLAVLVIEEEAIDQGRADVCSLHSIQERLGELVRVF